MKLAGERICKRYQADILRDCSLEVGAGECVVVRGVSGGGKSTLLRILALLEPADSGIVVHEEIRLDPLSSRKVLPYPFLTLVFQQLFLWPHLTFAQNLAIVLSHDTRAALRPDAQSLLERLAIDSLLDRKPHECSVGQQQRLAVARAVLSAARFLLLDEPSSALDQASRELIVNVLAAEKLRGRGLLIVTHDERVFDGIADQRLMLDAGRLRPF